MQLPEASVLTFKNWKAIDITETIGSFLFLFYWEKYDEHLAESSPIGKKKAKTEKNPMSHISAD